MSMVTKAQEDAAKRIHERAPYLRGRFLNLVAVIERTMCRLVWLEVGLAGTGRASRREIGGRWRTRGMRLGKEQVAVRQLDIAIRLLFDGGDAVSVHTLACAAANVLRDILKAQGGEAWQEVIIESHPGMEQEVRQTLARAQNFFKHANRDPEKELDFDENTNDEIIIVATLEYGELLRLGAPSGRTKVTTPMSVFQLWYFAKDPRVLLKSPNDSGVQIVTEANRLFPGLESIPRVEQLARGAEVLRRREAALSGRG
jgi:hypothetical protein